MIAVLSAGKTAKGAAIERTVHVFDCPRAAAITQTLTDTAGAVEASPEATAYVDALSACERLANALMFLQNESGRMYESSIRDFSAAVEKSIDAAAERRATPEKVLLSFDLADRVHRGFSILVREAGSRLTEIKPSQLIAEAGWLEALCVEIERRLAEHQNAVAAAMIEVVRLEGGADLGTPEGTYTSELLRVIGELSENAKSLRKQARELIGPREPESESAFFANLNSKGRREQ